MERGGGRRLTGDGEGDGAEKNSSAMPSKRLAINCCSSAAVGISREGVARQRPRQRMQQTRRRGRVALDHVIASLHLASEAQKHVRRLHS